MAMRKKTEWTLLLKDFGSDMPEEYSKALDHIIESLSEMTPKELDAWQVRLQTSSVVLSLRSFGSAKTPEAKEAYDAALIRELLKTIEEV